MCESALVQLIVDVNQNHVFLIFSYLGYHLDDALMPKVSGVCNHKFTLLVVIHAAFYI